MSKEACFKLGGAPVGAHSRGGFELQMQGNKDRASPYHHASPSATQRGPLPRILDAGSAPSEALHLPGAPLPRAQFGPFVLKETCGLFCILMLAVSGYAKI